MNISKELRANSKSSQWPKVRKFDKNKKLCWVITQNMLKIPMSGVHIDKQMIEYINKWVKETDLF